MVSNGALGRADDDEPMSDEVWHLRLYIAGQTPNSIRALANLRQICERELGGNYSLEIIDLLENPELSKKDQVVAIPTLVRRLPPPIKKIVGSLHDIDRVLIGLDVKKGQPQGGIS